MDFRNGKFSLPKFRPTRLRTALLLGTAFVGGIAVGPLYGALNDGLGLGWAPPGMAAQAAGSSRSEQIELLRLFGDVFERVRSDYVEPVGDRQLVESALDGMLTSLDPHSNFMGAKAYRDMQVQTRGEFGGLGLEVSSEGGLIKVVSPIDDTPAARAGVKAGDLITMLDGQTVQGLSLNDAVDRMRGPPGSNIRLTIKRDGVDTPINLAMQREVIRIQVVKSRLVENDIAYIRLTSFSEQTDTAMRRAFQQLRTQAGGRLRGVVLDLRNNPGGLLDQAVQVSNDFLNQGEIVSTRARHADESQRWDAKANGDITGGLPMIVLTNNGSASASEIVAGALQDHRRAVVLGTRSFGKGSVQTVIQLPGGTAMRLTTARYYTPSGRSIQGLGITPDVEVNSSRTELPRFLPEREADLNHVLSNQGGTPPSGNAPARTDLPAVAKEIPKLPPEGFPTFDASKPDTDFQLQEAVVVLKAMAQQRRASAL